MQVYDIRGQNILHISKSYLVIIPKTNKKGERGQGGRNYIFIQLLRKVIQNRLKQESIKIAQVTWNFTWLELCSHCFSNSALSCIYNLLQTIQQIMLTLSTPWLPLVTPLLWSVSTETYHRTYSRTRGREPVQDDWCIIRKTMSSGEFLSKMFYLSFAQA